MSADIANMLRMMRVLGEEGFVDALTNVERLVEDVDETLDRVEQIEGDAEQAVREANEALNDVDRRLAKFDETISLLEAKIEAGFSIGFFFFGLNQYLAGDLLFAAGLFFMGLLGASSLLVTIVTMPQVQRLRQLGRYASGRGERRNADTSNEKTRTQDEQSTPDRDRESDSSQGDSK